MVPDTSKAEGRAQLPLAVMRLADVGRLIRELGQIDESLLQLGLRESGAPVQLPKTTRLLEQTARLNGFNLLQTEERKALSKLLEDLRSQAPVLHLSFSTDPPPVFLEKLIDWLRREIHPQALLNIGLQPNIGAGCVLRTTNKYFDFSLRQDFERKRDLLKAALTPEAKA